MTSFPNAKINIGLKVLGKRSDGYHNISTIFYPIPFRDSLEIISSEVTTLTTYGLPVSGNSEDNLVIRAWHLLKEDFPPLKPVHFHLLKTIPMGAGLGGGSADGAFALKMLNERFKLGLNHEQLIAYALKLGSDCPFFIANKPALASGRGELLADADISITGHDLILITPDIHINTAKAFAMLADYKDADSQPIEVPLSPIERWKDTLSNDFEAPVFKMHPELTEIKKTLYAAGALHASMSGSGSSLYGIFPKNHGINIPFSYPFHRFSL
ncbi:MAG: 4-(cytidine 5'-diphospho)-2-C-methyl-D-erythritol kinase [Gemmatimonadaceae bacterium]|nr:4-(cytidine 5'-diphospho)-2-C-methyl-D-erythritol kinase [Chitinophagaceae bacterium]